jgi:hypothetical protein
MGNIGQLAKFKLNPIKNLISPLGKKVPMKFNGWQDMREIGGPLHSVWTANEQGIPGALSSGSTTYGDAMTARGFRVPDSIPGPEVYNALKAKPPLPEVDPITRDMRVQHLRKTFGI